MASLIDLLAVTDPRERLAHQLKRLDEMRGVAERRQRASGFGLYSDPDMLAILKAEDMATRLLAEFHARTLSSVESIGTLDRAQAIAELEAVLAVWKDPAVSDEQWKASRQAAPPVEVKPRAGVVRRKKA